MSKVYAGSHRILIRWIERMSLALHEQGSAYVSGDGGSIDALMKSIRALADLNLEPCSTNIPASDHFQVGQQWIDIALDDIFNFNSMGAEYICSTTEAVIKCHGIKRLFDKYTTPFFFRGEHIFGWELKSRLGRKLEVDWSVEDAHHITLTERSYLAAFQFRCQHDETLRGTVFGDAGNLLDLDHSGWWSLMQHYDDRHGTRMIDITTSLNCALFFACADWDGTIDDNADGKLYMFPYRPGRGETDFPDRHGDILIGTEDERTRKVAEYFSVENNLDIPRFRVSPARNDRALSQDGYFVWQPYFDRPLSIHQVFPFRIHRDFKRSIVNELAAMGYTRERILSTSRYGI